MYNRVYASRRNRKLTSAWCTWYATSRVRCMPSCIPWTYWLEGINQLIMWVPHVVKVSFSHLPFSQYQDSCRNTREHHQTTWGTSLCSWNIQLPGCLLWEDRKAHQHTHWRVCLGSQCYSQNQHHLRNVGWQKGDAILKSNTLITFLWGVTEVLSSHHHLWRLDKATRSSAGTNPHLTLEMIEFVPPYTLDWISEALQVGLKKIQSSLKYMALTVQGKRPKILVIADAISSDTLGTGHQICKTQENVWMFVDVTHAIGRITRIDLHKTQPDFFISMSSTFVMFLVEAERWAGML